MEVGMIEKGKDRIIVSQKEFKGKEYVDIRVYFENAEGDWIPTKKGISISYDNVDEIITILQKTKKKSVKKDEEEL
ncbi:MAG: Transcriptional Coactivator p15 (PC4) [Syntrophorhabdus sp. PtaU1.Bin002]|nr:MAG: Transcriptional Coactivator p15 (PC4) [Syntrophorhabdus sp. PtaU1.Bin002]